MVVLISIKWFNIIWDSYSRMDGILRASFLSSKYFPVIEKLGAALAIEILVSYQSHSYIRCWISIFALTVGFHKMYPFIVARLMALLLIFCGMKQLLLAVCDEFVVHLEARRYGQITLKLSPLRWYENFWFMNITIINYDHSSRTLGTTT